MSPQSSYRIFLSAASVELATYRQKIAHALRRKGIEVRDQEHFRQGGSTLLESLNQYIDECDAVICLIGDQCGSLPTKEHMAVMGDGECIKQFRQASGQHQISYTQWEFLLAKSHNKPIYVYLTVDGFTPDKVVEESELQRNLQSAYRGWIKQIGHHWEPLTTPEQVSIDVLVQQFPDLRQAQPNNLPFASLGSLFKGREKFLQELHRQLQPANDDNAAVNDKANPQRARVIYGSGGIGKTRAVIEYAWRNAADYNAALLLSAQTPELLNSNLAGLTDELQLEGLSQAVDEIRINEVLNWLQTNPGWLLILDNVDTDDAAAACKDLLPRLDQGHVIITSRLSQWSGGVKTLDLGVLESGYATDYLLEASDANRTHTDHDSVSAEQVALKAGRLALGLEHAAAFINARYLGFDDYLELWERDEAKILESFDLNLIDYPHELLVTWTLSVSQLDDAAKELLEVLGWLSSEPLPDTFFQAVSDKGHLAAREAIGLLCKYSLANRIQEGNTRGFQIHSLVQSTTRYQQLQKDRVELPALSTALAWVNETYQGKAADVRDWPTLEPLAEHVAVLCQFADDNQKTGNTYPTSRLLNDLAQLYHHKARLGAAEPLMRRALKIDEESFGADHPNVAIRLNNLASLLKATNRVTEAEPLMRRALKIDEESFGADHPNVAIRLNNLASLLKATNRVTEAEPLMRRALKIDEESFGADHPNVAIRLNNLASLLKATNRLTEAEPLMRRVVEIFRDFGVATGYDHPHLQAATNNYKNLLVESGLSDDQALERVRKFFRTSGS